MNPAKVRLPGYERDEYGALRAETADGYAVTMRVGDLGWNVSITHAGEFVASFGTYPSAADAAREAAGRMAKDRRTRKRR